MVAAHAHAARDQSETRLVGRPEIVGAQPPEEQDGSDPDQQGNARTDPRPPFAMQVVHKTLVDSMIPLQ